MRASYLLVLQLPQEMRIKIANGTQCLERGYYIYLGSACVARPYLRVLRHFSSSKKARWHIDYLTLSGFSKPLLGVVLYGVSEEALYQTISRQVEIRPALPKFGTTDRRNHTTHLFKVERTSILSLVSKILVLARSLGPDLVEIVVSEYLHELSETS
ncbi:MAG: DUF123 domain-containing protein [Sulfolobales archaeon]|nr:DUF123 domain-containing protein [Sulfolobales archaeon]MCX8208787.1 DUF123 domain-containing protein [Sulfolobales archaeon]MDW8011182.1 DUF123 domain-containing protein [Sulfolobales archaeon]